MAEEITFDQMAADGAGSIEFENVKSGIIAFNEVGLMIGLENGYDVGLLNFEVQDGKLLLVNEGVFDIADDPDQTMETLLANSLV